MNILQICHKPPFPAIDGGCIAIKNISYGLLDNGCNLKILTISTAKHPFNITNIPKDFVKNTKIENVYVDTKINIVDAFSNLVTFDSYNISRFFSPDFNYLLIKTLKEGNFDIILLESLFTTPYIKTIRDHSKSKIVLRSHNLEHIIWKRLAKETINPAKKIYLNLLSKQLESYETTIIKEVDGIAAISKDDEIKYKNLNYSSNTTTIPFGININNYNAKESPNSSIIKFFHLGAMDWKPNQEAVVWLLEEVWPSILNKLPNAELHLAGKEMPEWILNKKIPNVHNHKNVKDAIKFMNSYDVMLVPLLSAGGVRVKIIEGMALSKTIISTSIGAEGLNYMENKNIIIANDAMTFSEKALELSLDINRIKDIGKNARKHVSEFYDQNKISTNLIKFFNSI